MSFIFYGAHVTCVRVLARLHANTKKWHKFAKLDIAQYVHCTVYTEIRLVSISAKFGICIEVRILASTSVPYRPTTVQMLYLALFETKRIIVHVCAKILVSGLG